MAYCNAVPVLECRLDIYSDDNVLMDSKVIHEGELLHDLKYLRGGEEVTVTGILKVINFTSKAITTGKDGCYHDDVPVFDKQITINSLIVDCSEAYECNILNIPAKFITGLESTEEVPVDGVECPCGCGMKVAAKK